MSRHAYATDEPNAHYAGAEESTAAAMLTLTNVFSVHRFIAGPFGVCLLGFPTGVLLAISMLPSQLPNCTIVSLFLFRQIASAADAIFRESRPYDI